MFPSGTIQSGLSNVAISQGTTTIQFPSLGAMSPGRRVPAPDTARAHASTFGFAYANDIARASMSARIPTDFTTGSVIVREKLRAPNSTAPEVLVVMLKRESGFNQKANDWEFLTISGDLKKVVQREREGKCLACHGSEAKNDFVFRYPAP
jgi:hypothetical protein